MGVATQHLIQEHQKILLLLQVLEEICTLLKEEKQLPKQHIEILIRYFEVFSDKLHHGKEEMVLFPALLAKGFPLGGGALCTYFKSLQMMGPTIEEQIQEIELNPHLPSSDKKNSEWNLPVLEEHHLGRRLVQRMRFEIGKPRFVEFALRFNNFLREHIEKENRCLFPMADDCLSELQQKKLVEEFEKIEQPIFSSEEFKFLEKEWKQLKEIYPSKS